MHRPDECKRALCLLRGTAGGFFKTSHAVTSEARAEHLELFHRATTLRKPCEQSLQMCWAISRRSLSSNQLAGIALSFCFVNDEAQFCS